VKKHVISNIEKSDSTFPTKVRKIRLCKKKQKKSLITVNSTYCETDFYKRNGLQPSPQRCPTVENGYLNDSAEFSILKPYPDAQWDVGTRYNARKAWGVGTAFRPGVPADPDGDPERAFL